MLTMVLAVVLLAAFFLPYYQGFVGKVSGFDIVSSGGGGWEKYVLLIIPIGALLLLVGALNNGNYPGGRSLLVLLPLLGVLFLLIIAPLINGVPFKFILQAIGKGYGIGLWITIAVSLILPFYNPKD